MCVCETEKRKKETNWNKARTGMYKHKHTQMCE